MTIAEVAQVLLNRKNAGYSFILDGATRAKLTPEGFEFARNHGWIELDESTQCMRISMRAVKLTEIKSAAADSNSPSICTATPTQQSSGHILAVSHVAEMTRSMNADVVVNESAAKVPAPAVISEDKWRDFMPFAGATCHGRATLDEYNPTPLPGAPTAPTAPGGETENYEVGDAVIIGEGGKTYQATVQAKQTDGSLVLSFGTDKPATVKPSYKKQEVARAKAAPGQNPAQPAAPKPATSTEPSPALPAGPAAPGVGRR